MIVFTTLSYLEQSSIHAYEIEFGGIPACSATHTYLVILLRSGVVARYSHHAMVVPGCGAARLRIHVTNERACLQCQLGNDSGMYIRGFGLPIRNIWEVLTTAV